MGTSNLYLIANGRIKGKQQGEALTYAVFVLITPQEPKRLGSRGLQFIRESLNIDSIPSLTATWIWPESIANMQSKIQALLIATGSGPGSLYAKILEESEKSPEVGWDAHVRLGDELCVAERAFLSERKRKMKGAFASYIGVGENQVREEDIPIVAIAASGGGECRTRLFFAVLVKLD